MLLVSAGGVLPPPGTETAGRIGIGVGLVRPLLSVYRVSMSEDDQVWRAGTSCPREEVIFYLWDREDYLEPVTVPPPEKSCRFHTLSNRFAYYLPAYAIAVALRVVCTRTSQQRYLIAVGSVFSPRRGYLRTLTHGYRGVERVTGFHFRGVFHRVRSQELLYFFFEA